MRLPEEDVRLFYRLNPPLLEYTNQQLGLLDNIRSEPELMALPVEERMKVRDALYEHTDLIDSFIEANRDRFSDDEVAILRGWKQFVRGEFYIIRHLKKHAIFLTTGTPALAYGVTSLGDDLADMFPYVPAMVETVLLPFRGQIIYDGYVRAYRISFGGGMRGGFNDSYQEAKAQFGVVTTLPFEPEEQTRDVREQLKFYLKSERNRQRYWDEIDDLIRSDPALLVYYHQEMGKIHARTYGKQLREIGLGEAWFAILQGVVVASGKTRREAEKVADAIVPAEKRGWVYLFHLKKQARG